jgi:cytoskeletal protein CcmA (bactofilin family)
VFIVISTGNQQQLTLEDIQTQELTQEAIDDLTSNEATVGDPKQLLTIESNAVFNGKVLVRDGLDVAGPITVDSALSLPGITVSGTSQFNEVLLNELSVAGNASVQGSLAVENNLSVAGSASFGGPISAPTIIIGSIQLNGDLSFTGHIDAGGGTPNVSNGGSAGSGSTVTVSGTDTAGTITVNIGSNASPGNLAVLTFSRAFTGNPHVVFTPVAPLGSASVTTGTFYLSSRSTNGFSIASTTAVASGSVSFDYIVID